MSRSNIITTSSLTRYSYTEINPSVFSLGDIVEIQITFRAIPLKKNKVLVHCTLQALTLLDNNHSSVRLLKYLHFVYKLTVYMTRPQEQPELTNV